MQIPSKQALLKELDSLGHGARLARVATLGRDGRGAPELRGLLEALLAGDWYLAQLGLEAAAGARDEALLLRALDHPSIRVRLQAAVHVARRVTDEAAIEAKLEDAAPGVRRRLLSSAVRFRRASLAERLLPPVRARWGAREAASLLSACGEETVRRELPGLGHAVVFWRRLAIRHPDPVLAELRRCLERLPPRERCSEWNRFATAVEGLSDRRAAELLDLALRLSPPEEIPACVAVHLGRWSLREAGRVFALLSRPSGRTRLALRGLPTPLARHARRLGPEQLAELARILAESPPHLAALLAGVAPGARAALFEAACAVQPLGERVLPGRLLEVLPHRLRDEQAARVAGMREVRDDAAALLKITSYRDVEAVRGELEKACRAAKAEDRAAALAALVASTGRSRRGMTATLDSLARLRNEQDPVRLAALGALRRVPPSCFEPEHAEALSAMTDWVTEARDTSPATRNELQELAFALMRRHAGEPEEGLFGLSFSILQRLAVQAGSLSLPSLEANLPRGAEQRILGALHPLIRDANRRESHQLVIALAGSLGRRAWGLDLLQKLLEPVTEATPDGLARWAISLWLASPRTRDARVKRLLEHDRSAIAVQEVFLHLHRRRQEWLDGYLDGKPARGRFLTGKTVFVLQAEGGFERWLPRQQRALAILHQRIAADAQRSHWERAHSLRVLARMPVVDDEMLAVHLAGEVPVAEAALGALAWIDRPDQALPLLMQHLDGDRARVAMYAVPRCARLVPPSVLGERLEELLDGARLKVTVHKEALRLLGAFRPPGALPLLEREWKESKHRDVRIAAGHAARSMLEEEAAWEILEQIAADPDPDLARSVLDESGHGLSDGQRRRYGALLLKAALHPELRNRKAAYSALACWPSGAELQIAEAAAGRLLDLEQGAEWQEALGALVAACRDGGEAAERLVAAVAGLVSSPRREEWDAGAGRDLPARQRLQALLASLRSLPWPVRTGLGAIYGRAAEALRAEATLGFAAASLEIAALDWNEPEPAAPLLERAAVESAKGGWTELLAARISRELLDPSVAWEPPRALALVDRLCAGDEACARIGLAVLAVAGARLSWSGETSERLRRLRGHPAVAVRAAALEIWTCVE